MGMLYMVATPIGNLEDITFRAVRILKEADFVIAEDTRHSKILFDRYDIKTPLCSFHAQSSLAKVQTLIDRIKKGESAAYISDAGTPCVSDPGFALVREAVKEGIPIVPIPGASALTSFLSVSGLPADEFIFHGFLPHKKGRQTILQSFSNTKIVHIFYESVHRFPRLLEELLKILESDHPIAVGRELTKQHEEIFRGTVAEAMTHFMTTNTKGEFVVGIAPCDFSQKNKNL